MKTIYKKLLFFMLLLPLGAFAQAVVSGTVLDNTGQPLPGVNIVVQGTSNGVSTDFDGKYQISNVANGNVLVFSYVGYAEQSVTYNGQPTIDITMQEDANQLSEVVVQVGYGSIRKKDATGSVAVLTEKDFNQGAIVTADQLLTGKVAGVRITTSGGQPDADPNIRIRGGASLSASNRPLIIIDGVPIDNNNPAGISNPLTLVNPNDIASFSILKDASATAIYGNRASNGVIIITTKSGASSKPEFNYSANFSFASVTDKINVMNSSQFVRFMQEYHSEFTNFLGTDDPTTEAVDNLETTDVIEGRIIHDTDWQDEIFRESFSTDHNFSARANLYKKIPARFSLGYTSNQGVVRTNDFERLSYSIKLTPRVLDDHLRIDLNAKGMFTDKNAIDADGAINNAVRMDPTKPVYGPSPNDRFGGYYQDTFLDTDRYSLSGQYNPVNLLEERNRPERVVKFLGNAEFDYKMHFLPELRAVVNLGLEASRAKITERFSDRALVTYRIDTENPDPETNYLFNPGVNYRESQHVTNTTMDSYLVYTKSLSGFLTRIDAQGGYSYQNFKNDGIKTNYRYNDVTGEREENINPNNLNNRYYNVLNLQSFFGRVNFDLADKYLFTFTFRADGSSLFNEDNRWGYFPAAGAAWKIKEEAFLKDSKTITDLKLRVGYGRTGQQNITDAVGFYPSTPLFAIGNNNSQYLPGVNSYTALPFDENLTWETTNTYNAGLDFAFFEGDVLNGSVDVYRRTTEDLLAVVAVPPGQGLSDSFIKNIGSTENEGIEMALNFNPIQKETFTLGFNANAAYNRGEVTDLKEVTSVQARESGLPVGTNVILAYHTVGQQPYSAWVFEQVYDGTGNPIVGAYRDRNGDGQITNDDRYYKAMRPNWTFGFGFNMNFRQFDLTTSFRGQFDGQVYNTRRLVQGYVDRAIPNVGQSLTNVLDFYSGEADPNFVNLNDEIQYSDYYLENATFLRCENITLGYTFNELFKTARLRIYGAVNNAFLVTKYSGQDPENFNGIDNNFYPRPRVYTFGLSMDF